MIKNFKLSKRIQRIFAGMHLSEPPNPNSTYLEIAGSGSTIVVTPTTPSAGEDTADCHTKPRRKYRHSLHLAPGNDHLAD
jgi:hypothetical protein